MSFIKISSLIILALLTLSNSQGSEQNVEHGLIEIGKWVVSGPAGRLPVGRSSITSGTNTVTFTEDNTASRKSTQKPASTGSVIPDPWEENPVSVPTPPDLPPLGSICPLANVQSAASPSMSVSTGSMISRPVTSNLPVSTTGISSSAPASSAPLTTPQRTSVPEQRPPDEDKAEIGKAIATEGSGGVDLVAVSLVGGAAAAAALVAGLSIPQNLKNLTGSPNNAYVRTSSSAKLPTVKIMHTRSTLDWNYGASVDARKFNGLLDRVQAAVNGGQSPTEGKPFVIVNNDIKFIYKIEPGRAEYGTPAFNGTVALFQWFRLDGGSNLATGYVNDANSKIVAWTGVWLANTTNRICC